MNRQPHGSRHRATKNTHSKKRTNKKNPHKVHLTQKRGIMNVFDHRTHEEIDTYGQTEGRDLVATSTLSANFMYMNRPKQLNALSLSMIRDMTSLLRKYETNPGTLGLVISGIGDKAFCAGGDIMALYKAGSRWVERGDRSGYEANATFFREEYQMNWMISKMVTPLITFMNGITMGGGVGVGMHAQHKIATEKTLFAMPETSIGFFPDVGASHLLPRLPHKIGMYLALTGQRLKGADLVHLGLANQFMFTHDYPHLYNGMSDDHHSIQNVTRIVNEAAYDTDQLPKLSLTPHIKCIERCFSKGSVEEIIEALKQETEDVEFAQKTLKTLETVSPLSLKVTHEQMTRGATMDLDEVLTMEYRIARHMISNKDFYTGVKSVLIDKTNRGKRPNWKHNSVQEVSEQEVAKYFEMPRDGLGDLDVIAKEPVKGNGWEGIRRITFDEDNTDVAGPSDYQYPMFSPLPQQKFPVEWTTTHEFGASRDIFHLMYWNYLFKHTHTRFPLSEDPAEIERKILSAHAQQVEQSDYQDLVHDITGLDQFIQPNKNATMNLSYMNGEMAKDFFNLPRTLHYQRQALMQAKKFVDITPHPDEKKKMQTLIDQLTPSSPDEASTFNILNDAMDKLSLKYPMAAFVLHKLRDVSHPLPLLVENLGFTSPNEGRETFFAEEIMFKYPTEQVIAIKQQLKKMYTEMCDIYNLPHESAPALMAAEVGSKNVSILGVFGDEWESSLTKVNPETGIEYGDLYQQFLNQIDQMSYTDAKKLSHQLGMNVSAEALYPDDPQKQKVYQMMLDTVEHRAVESEKNHDAFSPEKLLQRYNALKNNTKKSNIFPEGTVSDPNPLLTEMIAHPFLPHEKDYTNPHEDDVNVKGMFSDGEIDLPQEGRFLTNKRRRKLEQLMHNELSKLEAMGAKLTPIEGGIMVENFENQDEVLDSLQITKHRFNVTLAADESQLPDDLKTGTNSLILRVKEFDDPDSQDDILKELMSTDDPTAPIASGGHYHGATELLQKLTISRKKMHLTDTDVSTLKTKHAIFIPASSANLESNAGMLQRLLSSRVPLPFDRQVNENKVVQFAEALSEHLNPNQPVSEMSEWKLEQRQNKLINDAVRAAYSTLATDPVRITDSGEILDGEIIPASIQKHMKPYEAKVQRLPTPNLFHTSATLTALTHQFQHVLSPKDQGEAIAVVRSFDHLTEGQPELKNKEMEYVTAKKLYLDTLTNIGNSIQRPDTAPTNGPHADNRNKERFVKDITSPHPVLHDFFTQADEQSVFMPLSSEERLARSFLSFIRVPDYALDAVYPGFNYFLDDQRKNPGFNFQLNFEGANPYVDHPDSFKINYGDISRPMLPPKFANAIKAQVDKMAAVEGSKGCQKL